MQSSEFNTDIFFKAGKKIDDKPVSDVFNISPLLFKISENGISDITDTNKINSRLINAHRALLDSDFLPEITENLDDSFSATSTEMKSTYMSDTSHGPTETFHTISSFSLPMNSIGSASRAASSFSYTTEEGLTSTSTGRSYRSSSNNTTRDTSQLMSDSYKQ
jgi:hypothetical protein